MSQVGTSQDRLGGEYMIQDRDHMSEIDQRSESANRRPARQVEQSHSENRQQGDGNDAASKRQGGRRSQAH